MTGRTTALRPALKTAGIYDPEAITLKEVVVPPAAADLPVLAIDEIVRLTGDASRGKTTVTRCLMCHTVGGTGAELGPALDGWGRGKSADVIATAIVNPNAEIALGYEGMEFKTKDGLTIQGVLIKQRRSADDAKHGRDSPRSFPRTASPDVSA